MSMLKVCRALTRSVALRAGARSVHTAALTTRAKAAAAQTAAQKATALALQARAVVPRRLMSGSAHSESKGPGTPPGGLSDSLEQGCGIEHEELSLLANESKVRFDRRPLVGPFGTVAAPVKVPSGLDARLVACMGGGKTQPQHAMIYFNVEKGHLTACPQCGQVFTLSEVEPVTTAQVAEATAIAAEH